MKKANTTETLSDLDAQIAAIRANADVRLSHLAAIVQGTASTAPEPFLSDLVKEGYLMRGHGPDFNPTKRGRAVVAKQWSKAQARIAKRAQKGDSNHEAY